MTWEILILVLPIPYLSAAFLPQRVFFALVWNHYVCEFPPLIEFPFPIHPIGFRDWIYFMVLCYFPPSTLIYRLSAKAAVVRYRYVNFGCNL